MEQWTASWEAAFWGILGMPLFLKVLLPSPGGLGTLTRGSVLGEHWPSHSPAQLLLMALHMQAALGKMVFISPQSSNTSSFPLFRLEDPSSFQKVLSPIGVNSWLHWQTGSWKSIIAPKYLLGIVVIFSQSSVPGDTSVPNPWLSEAPIEVMHNCPVGSRIPPSPPKKDFLQYSARASIPGFLLLVLWNVAAFSWNKICESVFDVPNQLYQTKIPQILWLGVVTAS